MPLNASESSQEKCEKKNWRNELRDIGLLILLGLVMTWAGLSCDDCDPKTKIFWIVASFTSLTWVILFKGNDYLGSYLSTKISWIQYPVKRFFIGVISTFAFTGLSIYLLQWIYTLVFDVHFSYAILYTVIITVVISLFMHSRAFLLNLKESTIIAEKLKRENIAARYESLKSQVNPHFLFNSFNALSNLVYEDPDKAVKFIKQLSEVYRYVLDTREKELVTLEEELKFLQSYLYLQNIRFENKLKINISEMDLNGNVAPLALQMLMENAIKHNVVSEDEPLTIDVFQQDGYFVVQNNLQIKSALGEPSAGVGLENITKRYEFLSSKKVVIEKTKTHFVVKLPVLTL